MFNLKKDIEDALKKYKTLDLISTEKGSIIVKGSFIAYDFINRIEIENYDVLISFPRNYPYSFPIVVETSQKIPRDISRHVKSDGALCLANWQDELSLCRKGISFKWFLDKVLNIHLCREYVREKTGEYPTGERSHGHEGIWEGYFEIFNTTDKLIILKELDLIFNHKKLGRNTFCYCNSGKIFKACHEKIELKVDAIGRSNAKIIFNRLKKDYEENENTK